MHDIKHVLSNSNSRSPLLLALPEGEAGSKRIIIIVIITSHNINKLHFESETDSNSKSNNNTSASNPIVPSLHNIPYSTITMIIHAKAIITTTLLVAFVAVAEARLNRDKTTDDADEMRLALQATRTIKAAVGVGNNKGAKTNKNGISEPSDPPSPMPSASKETAGPTTMPTWIPNAHPTADPTRSPTSPTSKPTSAPAIFDSTIEVVCKPDGTTALTQYEAKPKIIICNSAKPSCREAVAAVKKSEQLQNFFGCAGDLGEGAARKLFNKYASDDMLAGQLALIAATKPLLVTERPDAMEKACMTIGMAQSPPVADPCCQGPSGCTSVTGSASNSPPFMTIAITACTGDSACKDMGPNPLILDTSCTGVSACELMNENEINPFITGVTFVGEMACTTPQSCEGVGRRSHGDVTIQTGACIGSEACNSTGRRVVQKAPSFRFRSHIAIGENACVGSNACKEAHSTVNHGAAGKYAGSLSIGDGGCADEGSCEKLGLNDRMRTNIIVPPGGCGRAKGCRGCMTKTECDSDEVYIISDVDGACPKGGSSSGGNPTGDKVEEFCIGKDTLPTECPTFSPTPFPTPVTLPPTSAPTSAPTLPPASFTVGCLSTPGTETSTFNSIDGDILCDGATGTCADFVAAVDTLGDKGKMVKSIFGCNDEDPPRPVTLDVAQERFDKIKNEESVTKALLAIVNEDKELFTGSATAVTKACGVECCRGKNACTVDSVDGGVMTVSSGSCMGARACKHTRPNTIMLDSCKGTRSCLRVGNFRPNQPVAGVEAGFRVIGPRACLADLSCNSLGVNAFGDIRIEEGACDANSTCTGIARRRNQGSTTTKPVVASVFVGKNACQGGSACRHLHRSIQKFAGGVIIEAGACSGASTCQDLGENANATNDIIVRAGVCTTGATCADCAQASLCNINTETYVIDNAGMDCPGPEPSACKQL